MKKVLVLLISISLIFLLTGCGQNGNDLNLDGDGESLVSLEATSGEEIKATFDDGETITTSNFDPKPLSLGEETAINFQHEGKDYSDTVTYTINISGNLNSQVSQQNTVRAANVGETDKVVLFFGRDYKISKIENGSFNIELDREEPGGIAFLDSNNQYIGYLSLPDGLDSFPTQAISSDTGEINLGEVNFDENGVGTIDKDPFASLDPVEKSALAVSGSFFSAALRSPEVIEKLVNDNERIGFGLNYFPTVNFFDENNNGYLSSDNMIKTHRLILGFEPGLKLFKDVNITYPDKNSTQVDVPNDIPESEANERYIIFPGVGLQDRATEVGPPIPPAGDYKVSGGGLDFTFNLPDIQNDAEKNLVFPVPNVEVNEDGIIEEINWTYKNRAGKMVSNPENIISNIEIQINAKSEDLDTLKGDYESKPQGPARIYNSGQLAGKEVSHGLSTEEIYWEDVDNIDLAYNDIYRIHYVVGFSKNK